MRSPSFPAFDHFTLSIAMPICRSPLPILVQDTSSLHYAGQERSVSLAAILYTGLVFVIASILNIIAISYGATIILPFGSITVILVIFIILVISLLVFGGVVGYCFRIEFQSPSSTKRYPREIQQFAWYRRTLFQIFIGGLVSFSAIEKSVSKRLQERVEQNIQLMGDNLDRLYRLDGVTHIAGVINDETLWYILVASPPMYYEHATVVGWFQETFGELPKGADEPTVRRWLPYVARLEDMGGYSYRSTALAWLYGCMCRVANRHVVKFAGLLQLLQSWIFWLFSGFRPARYDTFSWPLPSRYYYIQDDLMVTIIRR
ncbi:hypothetical protein Ahy_B07g088332 [Arachis hypogaea]|uniref:Transmembrane 9 superfamily member n=1 Tax=Arachis hypogaea TaxID=3818 RepID=A0A444YEA0_ARAHY|nr:hypothetical protein Ahy_B07g088332 [Arachis hypogaea]